MKTPVTRLIVKEIKAVSDKIGKAPSLIQVSPRVGDALRDELNANRKKLGSPVRLSGGIDGAIIAGIPVRASEETIGWEFVW